MKDVSKQYFNGLLVAQGGKEPQNLQIGGLKLEKPMLNWIRKTVSLQDGKLRHGGIYIYIYVMQKNTRKTVSFGMVALYIYIYIYIFLFFF